MNRYKAYLLVILILILIVNVTYSQVILDSSKIITNTDTLAKPAAKRHIPRSATIRSAIFPGLGQMYNHEYWKLPLVYGALAIPTYTYFYNQHYYQIIKYAYEIRFRQLVDTTYHPDANTINSIDAQVRNLDANSLLKYRNSFRKDRDYSIMWFFIVWGLNVVDATVFAHLKDFSVNDNLTMRIEPKLMPTGTFTAATGLELTFSLKNHEHRKIEIK